MYEICRLLILFYPYSIKTLNEEKITYIENLIKTYRQCFTKLDAKALMVSFILILLQLAKIDLPELQRR
jgi:hypothetical protein